MYHKAKSVTEPFAYSDYRKKRIQEKIEEARKNRVQVRQHRNFLKTVASISVELYNINFMVSVGFGRLI